MFTFPTTKTSPHFSQPLLNFVGDYSYPVSRQNLCILLITGQNSWTNSHFWYLDMTRQIYRLLKIRSLKVVQYIFSPFLSVTLIKIRIMTGLSTSSFCTQVPIILSKPTRQYPKSYSPLHCILSSFDHQEPLFWVSTWFPFPKNPTILSFSISTQSTVVEDIETVLCPSSSNIFVCSIWRIPFANRCF